MDYTAAETVEALAGSAVAPVGAVLGHAGLYRDGLGIAEPFDSPPAGDVDLLRQEYDECLDALAEIRCDEARLAARKAREVARCAQLVRALAPPSLSLQEQSLLEVGFVAEVAGC